MATSGQPRSRNTVGQTVDQPSTIVNNHHASPFLTHSSSVVSALFLGMNNLCGLGATLMLQLEMCVRRTICRWFFIAVNLSDCPTNVGTSPQSNTFLGYSHFHLCVLGDVPSVSWNRSAWRACISSVPLQHLCRDMFFTKKCATVHATLIASQTPTESLAFPLCMTYLPWESHVRHAITTSLDRSLR